MASYKNILLIISILMVAACATNRVTHTEIGLVDKTNADLNERYIIKGDLTVLDTKTKLLWEVKTISNSQSVFYWFKAGHYCNNLVLGGFTDWTLPTIDELKTLLVINKSLNNGYINEKYFQQNQSFSYWSSTEGYGHSGRYVDFDYGGDSAYKDSKRKHARCVKKFSLD